MDKKPGLKHLLTIGVTLTTSVDKLPIGEKVSLESKSMSPTVNQTSLFKLLPPSMKPPIMNLGVLEISSSTLLDVPKTVSNVLALNHKTAQNAQTTGNWKMDNASHYLNSFCSNSLSLRINSQALTIGY